MKSTPNRRPLKTRSQAWVGAVAGWLARSGMTPNQVSVLGIFIALAGAAAVACSQTMQPGPRVLCFVAAAFAVQLRLMCNLLDGLIAVEHGKKSSTGDLFNEVPDRIEDTVLLLGAGYAAGTPHAVTLGWLASLLAMSTAYIRALGGSFGFDQDFCGPFAKQQRMFFLTLAYLLAAGEAWVGQSRYALHAGLVLIATGTAFTLMRRLKRLYRRLQSRG
jgi:phosphatidylglycerophosphate synthase